MFSRLRLIRFGWAALVFGLAIGVASCQWTRGVRMEDSAEPCVGDCKVTHDKSMMALAHDLDHIEKHIDWYGSVVPKVPDVWGQARLTQHREEFEKEMAKDLSNFSAQLNGSVSRSDQAFLAQAITLGAAINGTNQAAVGIPSASSSATSTTQTKITPQALPAPAAGDPAKPLADLDAEKAIARTDAKVTAGTIALATTGIGLEPTIVLEQKARYLNYLNQIRRGNEGDDTADSPGYSLNLIRIPVSVLPGKKTQQGYGAEISLTLTPILGEELLPTTFRNLVINDLAEQLGYPLVKFLEEERLYSKEKILTESVRKEVFDEEEGATENTTDTNKPARVVNPTLSSTKFKEKLRIPSLPFSNGLGARQPLPTSQLLDAYGLTNAFTIAFAVNAAIKEDVDNLRYAHLPDIQVFLKEELVAAYRFLAQPENQSLWAHHCTPELVRAIRSTDVEQLKRLRRNYRDEAAILTQSKSTSVTTALAWTLIVDSALLTDRLVKDMREVASAKGVALPNLDWSDYYAPNPSQQARHSFNEYVKVRWPIRVFALDPVTQDQNISDSLSSRREMQFALSLAFVSGQINANSLTRYTRRLEAEYQTVALNRTQIGFSHGENTFGWRFTPRFQTPDTDSNLTVILRDQLVGGPNRNALLRQRRLEPGPRECVAIVLMPSFVPYLTCDSVTNWFSLSHPKHKEFDLADTLRISRAIKTVQVNGPNVKDADNYRANELQTMLRRVEQLDSRLPTQMQRVQVPILNNLSGFKMFNNGITDLGPELYGFYGAPGLDPNKNTTLFLVGDHFSVRTNKVIVGNYQVTADNMKLLSRQVLQITVPTNAVSIPYSYDGNKTQYVDINVATPYGVSREVYVPIVTPPAASPKVDGYTLKPSPLKIQYKVVGNQFTFAGPAKPTINVAWSGDKSKLPKSVKMSMLFDFRGQTAVEAASSSGVTFGADNSIDIDITDALKNLLKSIPAGFTPPASLRTVRVTITDGASSATMGVETLNALEIQFTEAAYSFSATTIEVTYNEKGVVEATVKGSPLSIAWNADPANTPDKPVLGLKYSIGGATTAAPDTITLPKFDSKGAATFDVDTLQKMLQNLVAALKIPDSKSLAPFYLKLTGTIDGKDTVNTLDIMFMRSPAAAPAPEKKKEKSTDGGRMPNGNGPNLGQIKPASFTQDDPQWTNSKKAEVKKDVVFVPAQK